MSKARIITKNQTIVINQEENIIEAAANTQVTVLLQSSGSLNITARRNAVVHVITLVQDKAKRNNTVNITLAGHGAEGWVSGIFHGQGKDDHMFDVTMRHTTQRTKGDILIRGTYQDAARGLFTGMIRIDKKAQQTISYFSDNILLFDQAMAVSVPNLEIRANDVRASHGSTTGRVDREQLFYLTARGIQPDMARCLIISGFFKPVIKRWQKDILASFDYHDPISARNG